MIYDTLDRLPIKTFYKIQETQNFNLLNPNEICTKIDLELLFDDLTNEYEMLVDSGADKIFFIKKEISHLESVKKLCSLGIEILKFQYNEEIKNKICEMLHLNIRTNLTPHYFKDLERCEKKISLLDKKINQLEKLIPKEEKRSNNNSIDDVLASICSILGVSFDFNTIPCTTYLAYKKQVDSKLKVQKEQLSKIKLK